MLIIDRPQTDPFFNIAAEEYLLKSLDEDCFMLWQNSASVIVGKHQNTLAEINPVLVRRLNIPVIRRISGGGAVYHDEGNLNFTFIKKGQPGKLVDFSQFIKPVVEVLNKIGVPARKGGKNDIRVNGLKISGNSEHVYRNKVLHHGTLLFNTNLEILNEVLMVKPGIYLDKSVRSIRSRVDNIVNLTREKISLAGFRDLILEHISRNVTELGFYKLSEADISGINDLVDNKYKTWKWNFGYSPNYIFKNNIVHQGKEYAIELEVEKGVIIDCKMAMIKDLSANLIHVNKLLIGIKHDYNSIREQIYLLNQKEEKPIFDPDILLELLFYL